LRAACSRPENRPAHRPEKSPAGGCFFRVRQGIFVLLIGLSALLLVHKDAWVYAESLLALLHISTDRTGRNSFSTLPTI